MVAGRRLFTSLPRRAVAWLIGLSGRGHSAYRPSRPEHLLAGWPGNSMCVIVGFGERRRHWGRVCLLLLASVGLPVCLSVWLYSGPTTTQLSARVDPPLASHKLISAYPCTFAFNVNANENMSLWSLK